RDDGTLPLPLVPPLKVEGLSLVQVQDAIHQAYVVDREIIKPERERILVTMIRPRQYHVLVVRQDSGALTFGPGGALGNTKRGTGAPVELPAYENDVLGALTRTGGLPGLDAMNEVVVQRGAYRPGAQAAAAAPGRPPDGGCNPGCAEAPPYLSAPG